MAVIDFNAIEVTPEEGEAWDELDERICYSLMGPEAERWDGAAPCPTCERPARDHRVHPGFDFFNVLCDGTVVKL